MVTVVTLALGLLAMKFYAPQLLNRGGGLPADIHLVQVDEKIPPFFEHIFAFEDAADVVSSADYTIF